MTFFPLDGKLEQFVYNQSMSAPLGLYRLQIVDSRLDEIHSRLGDIRQTLENDEAMKKAQKLVEQQEKNHSLTLQALKRAEEEVKAQKIKIEQSDARLYSGTVKNPKELQDLQNEVASLKRFLITLEDRQLEAMLEEETVGTNKQSALNTREALKRKLEEQYKDLTVEQEQLLKEQERFEAERQAALAPLDAHLLSLYDDLRKSKRGLAVTLVQDGACSACGTTLTPAMNQSVRSALEIHNCPSCKRVLYAN